VGLKLGGRWVIAVNGYEAVKEVLSRDDCAYRPDNVILTMRSFDKKLGLQKFCFSQYNLALKMLQCYTMINIAATLLDN
jgi:hypothetical protein